MIVRKVLGLLTIAALALVAATYWVSRPLFDEPLDVAVLGSVNIAPAEEALSFARYLDDGRPTVLLVRRYVQGELSGLDIGGILSIDSSDPLEIYARAGYVALQYLAEDVTQPEIAVAQDRLILPFDPPATNIGIGTNYLEHARESQVKEEPFLFPKHVAPTPFRADVAKNNSRLLDYEVELAFVALADLQAADLQYPLTMGLMLGNDYTDRWALVRNFDNDQAMGLTGFVDGKSIAGYAPIGPLLVIPKDLQAFYPKLELQLYVNGQRRQHDSAGQMIWGPVQMLTEIFRRESWTFQSSQGPVPLLNKPAVVPVVPRGTIIFSGTPAGVIFKPLNLWNASLYLQVHDEVVAYSSQLGAITNRIVN